MKNKLITYIKRILVLLIFLFLTSCFGERFPKIEYKIVNLDYSDTQACYNFPFNKEDFVAYWERSCLAHDPINDSIYRMELNIPEFKMDYIAKVLIKEQDGVTKLRLKIVDTIVFSYAYSFFNEACKNLNKPYFQNAFQKDYIVPLNNSIKRSIEIDSLYNEGLRQLKKNEFDNAFCYFQKIMNGDLLEDDVIDFVKYSVLNRMAFIKIQQKQYEKAIDLLTEAMKVEPYWLKIENRVKYKTKEEFPSWVHENYLDELKSQYIYNTENTEQILIHINFALAYIYTGQLQEAFRMLTNAEKLYPSEPYIKEIKELYLSKLKK